MSSSRALRLVSVRCNRETRWKSRSKASARCATMLREELVGHFPELVHLPRGTMAVGGAVRDLLLDVIPLDVDVECDEPLACASALGKVIALGRGELVVYRVVVSKRVYDFSRKTDLGRR